MQTTETQTEPAAPAAPPPTREQLLGAVAARLFDLVHPDTAGYGSDTQRAYETAAAILELAAAVVAPAPALEEGWHYIEIFGHRQVAGYCREVRLAGRQVVQVDVPSDPPRRQYLAGAALFAVHRCDEETVRTWVTREYDPQTYPHSLLRTHSAGRSLVTADDLLDDDDDFDQRRDDDDDPCF